MKTASEAQESGEFVEDCNVGFLQSQHSGGKPPFLT
jgi:hypothetical protein